MLLTSLIDPVDKGYIDICNFTLDSINFLDRRLTIRFLNEESKGFFKIHLDNIVAYNHDLRVNHFFFLRLDSDGSSYGLDISIRLMQPNYKSFMVLYLFEDEKHTRPAFRGLAEKVFVEFN